MRAVTVTITFLIAVAMVALYWYLPNRPRPLNTVYAGSGLASVSFAPYRADQDPIAGRYPTPAQIEEDLQTIAPRVKQVRTYSSRDGLDVVPPLAAKYGLKVMQGIWLNAEDDKNQLEIAGAVKLANAHPDTVSAVIVGNEVLLRRDLKRDPLINYIRQVKAQVKQPVTYADVWEFWLKNPQVAQEVDFITVHFLPYWEDDPTGVDLAMEHIRKVYRTIKQAFPDKPILIGEVGWPSAGRARERALPGRWEQAEFVNAFLKLAAEEGFSYNLIEAFDQRWKKALEGMVGGRWGLWTEDRQPKFDLTGPIFERPAWRLPVIATPVIALAGLIWWRRRLAAMTTGAAAGATLLAVLVAAMLGQQLLRLYEDDIYNGQNWAFWGWLRIGLQWLLAWALLDQTFRRLDGSAPAPTFQTWATVWSGGTRFGAAVGWFEWTYLVSVLTGGWLTVMLAVNGRYRDFPFDDFLVLCLGFVACRVVLWLAGRATVDATLLAWSGGRPPAGDRPLVSFDALVGTTVVIAGFGMLAREHLDNREACWWLVFALLIAVPQLATVWLGRITARPVG